MQPLCQVCLKRETILIELIIDGNYRVHRHKQAWYCYYDCSVNYAKKEESNESTYALEETYTETIGDGKMSLTVSMPLDISEDTDCISATKASLVESHSGCESHSEIVNRKSKRSINSVRPSVSEEQ